MANEIVRYNNVVIAIESNLGTIKRALVQSASIQGDRGLELLDSTTETLAVPGPREITVEITELATGIKTPNNLPLTNHTGIVYIGHPSGISVIGCLLEGASYSLSDQGFFTSTLTFKGNYMQGQYGFQSTADIDKTGRAPYRVYFDAAASTFSDEDIKSIDINYNISRSTLYSQGNPSGLKVLNYPVETTIDYSMYVAPSGETKDGDFMVNRAPRYTCNNTADKTGLNIKVGNDTITLSGCYFKTVAYDGAEVAGGPLTVNLGYTSYENYGLTRKITLDS